MINSQEILRLIDDRLLLLHTNEPFHLDIDDCREQLQQKFSAADQAFRVRIQRDVTWKVEDSFLG